MIIEAECAGAETAYILIDSYDEKRIGRDGHFKKGVQELEEKFRTVLQLS